MAFEEWVEKQYGISMKHSEPYSLPVQRAAFKAGQSATQCRHSTFEEKMKAFKDYYPYEGRPQDQGAQLAFFAGIEYAEGEK